MDDLVQERQAVCDAVQVLQHKVANIIAIRAEAIVARSSSPQQVCLREARECDIYVGVFGKRWGFVPETSNPEGLSATALEYEEAKNYGRTRLVMVSRDQKERDPRLDAWLRRIGKWEGDVYLKQYESLGDLKFWVLASLIEELMRHTKTEKQRSALRVYSDPRVRLQRSIVARFRYLRFNWLPQLRTVITDMPLESVYVSLRARPGIPKTDIPEKERGRSSFDPEHSVDDIIGTRSTRPRNSKALELDQMQPRGRCQVVLGAPGCGKTTYLRHIALQEARAGRLPLYAELRDYARALRRTPRLGLEQFLLKAVLSAGVEIDTQGLQQWIRSGECTILLDGLDEVPTLYWRQHVAERVMETVGNWLPHARIVVTSRIAGYRSAPLYGEVSHFTVEDLDSEGVQRFVRNWCTCLETKSLGQIPEALSSAEAKTANLTSAIFASARVGALARNPLMLTILVLIHQQGSHLPESRVDLYQRCTEALVESVDTARFQPGEFPPPGRLRGSDIRDMLRPLALALHRRKEGLFTKPELIAFLAKELVTQLGMREKRARHLAEELVVYIRERTGLLVERGMGLYGFVHMTFEEYFASVELVETEDLGKAFQDRLLPLLHDPRWREPILLGAGYLGGISRSRAEHFVRLIAEANSSPYEELLRRDLRLALRCLADDIRVGKHLLEYILRIAGDWIRSRPAVAMEFLREEEGLAGTHVGSRLVAFATPLMSHADDRIRIASLDLVARLGDGGRLTRLGILRSTRDKNPRVRWSAAFALSQIATSRERAVAVRSLKSRDPNLRWMATMLLEKSVAKNDSRFVSKLVDSRSFVVHLTGLRLRGKLAVEGDARLLESMLDSKDTLTRLAALEALSRARKPLPGGRSEQMLKDRSASIRAATIRVLTRSDQTLETKHLAALLSDPSTSVRAAAVGVVWRHQRTEMIARVRRLLKDTSHEVRIAALRALGGLGAREELGFLLPLLHDRYAGVRGEAVQAVATLGGRRAKKQLMRLYRDSSSEVRFEVASAMGEIGSRRDQQELLCLLKDRSESVRDMAAYSFASIVRKRDLALVEDMLVNPKIGVRLAAVHALRHLGTKEHLAKLNALFEDKSLVVQVAVAGSIEQILQRRVSTL